MERISCRINELIRVKELFSFFEKKHAFDYDFKGEQHDFWECVYVKSGVICVSADERVYRLEQNKMIFHKPMEFHKFYVDSPDGAEIFVFSFSAEGELLEYFRNKVFNISAECKRIISLMLEYAHKKMDSVDIPKGGDYSFDYFYPVDIINTYLPMLQTYIHQLLLLLADGGELSGVYHTAESDAFKNAVNYMNENIGSSPAVCDIARFCNVSEATLKRIFAKYAGISIHKYFLQLKIKRATEMLRAGASVSETADKLGFSSQCYFSAAYKRETGINPSEV